MTPVAPRETETDRQNERRIIDAFLRRTFPDLRAEKLKLVHQIDYALLDTDKQVQAWAEVKHRKCTREDALENKLWCYMNVTKWMTAVRLAHMAQRDFYYILETDDGHMAYRRFAWQAMPRETFPPLRWEGGKDEKGVPD